MTHHRRQRRLSEWRALCIAALVDYCIARGRVPMMGQQSAFIDPLTYIDEAEGQDGRAYWEKFTKTEDVIVDFELYIQMEVL